MNIDFPFHFSHHHRTASTGVEDHIHNMIEQFLFTNPGERLNRPEFGSGLQGLVFDPNSEALAATLQHNIQAGLIRWLGDLIEVRSVEVKGIEAELRVTVRYMIRRNQEHKEGTFPRSNDR